MCEELEAQICWKQKESETEKLSGIAGVACSSFASSSGVADRAFPDQMERTIPKKYNIGTALTRAADPQWHVRNATDRKELAPGTCGIKGAHFELKAWGRNVRSELQYRAKLMLMFYKISNKFRAFAPFFFPISPLIGGVRLTTCSMFSRSSNSLSFQRGCLQ